MSRTTYSRVLVAAICIATCGSVVASRCYASDPELARLLSSSSMFTEPLKIGFPVDIPRGAANNANYFPVCLEDKSITTPPPDSMTRRPLGNCDRELLEAEHSLRQKMTSQAMTALTSAGFFQTFEVLRGNIGVNCPGACKPENWKTRKFLLTGYTDKLYSCLGISANSREVYGSVAHRQLGKVTYRNAYSGIVNGVQSQLVSFVFDYVLTPKPQCKGLEALWDGMELKGKLTTRMDPTDGTWKVHVLELSETEPK